MITEIAIVISAWRRSWPWFQRRKSCWMTTPSTPITRQASTSGTSHPKRPYSDAEPVGEARLRFRPWVSSVNHPAWISKAT